MVREKLIERITQEEYYRALTVIQAYAHQVEADLEKTSLDNWCDLNIGGRARRGIKDYLKYIVKRDIRTVPALIRVLDKDEFLKMYGYSLKTYWEIEEAINKWKASRIK